MAHADVREVVLSPERKSFIQTLPSQKGWLIVDQIHLYRGFWYTTRHLNGLLSVLENYSDENSDMILLTTMPKTGTTWLKAILFALLNRSHHNPSCKNHPLLQDNPHHLVHYLETMMETTDHNMEQHSMSPRLLSTHTPFSSLPTSIKSSNRGKIVYLCRNPKDTFISCWHFAKKLIPDGSDVISLDEAFNMFCRGASPFGPYWEHVMEYWKASEEMPNRILFLKFEEIKEQPCEQLRRLAQFLECPFSPEEESNGQVEEIVKLCSFNNLSGLEVNRNGKLWSGTENNSFFRKGEVGDWINYFTHEMIERIDCITREKLHGSTLTLS